jgi:hypothetical protein
MARRVKYLFIYLFIYLFSRLYNVSTSSCAHLTIILSSVASLPSGASPGGGWGNAHQIWRVPGKQNTRGGPKLALLPCSLILAYQGLEVEKLDRKSPVPQVGG